MKIDFNFPRNLRVLFDIFRKLILVVAVLRLILVVVYPLMDLHFPTPAKMPLADVGLASVQNSFRVKATGMNADGVELAYLRGTLFYKSDCENAGLDALVRWRFFLCDAVDYLFLILLFDLLWQLCGNVERGEVFTERNIRLIRYLGLAILGFQAVSLVAGGFYARMASEFIRQHVVAEGIRMNSSWVINLVSINQGLIITGVLVLLLAEVFRQGLALKMENELTV